MSHSLIVLCLSCLLISCFSSARYRDISEFNLQPNALKEGESIRLLAAVIGDEDNQEAKYYNHLIAVSGETGDTVNILTPVNHGLTKADGERTFNYFSLSDPAANVILMESKELEQLTHIDSVKVTHEAYTKVTRHPDFEDIAQNNYPTIIGIIGTVSNRK